jgi:hypothetical protein
MVAMEVATEVATEVMAVDTDGNILHHAGVKGADMVMEADMGTVAVMDTVVVTAMEVDMAVMAVATAVMAVATDGDAHMDTDMVVIVSYIKINFFLFSFLKITFF